ncbi:nitroimidazol reductase NimA-like FMN-containing flavoprotein (pyridoxamine 5'-phosphate oxidase superfamily) [Bradyrhizobium diazoefficiens]
MDDLIRRKIQTLLDQHRTMRIATLRPDGWPQVTTVGYANEGFTIYFLCGIDSQKAQNLSRDDRVSLAIDDDPAQVMEITGVSMAARARTLTDPAEAEKAIGLLMARYPEQNATGLAVPKPSEVRLIALTPTVISLLDYSKGFGHTDLVAC